ncbi:uncharacterized protein [Diadema antillarum]|uniref:uncharacterized protein n=1 Tax=Diadema antillarum TaxID=105358 RepID=UPI003A887C86
MVQLYTCDVGVYEAWDSNQLFQLDEDDIFNSDSFLEELEHAEKQNQISTTSEVNDQHLPLTKPHDLASDYKGYTFKSKVSPIIPATTSKSNDSLANNAAGLIKPTWDKSTGKYQTKYGAGSGVPSTKAIAPQVNATRIPSPLCRLRQGNNSQFSQTQHTRQELSNQKHLLNSECMKPSLGDSFGNHQGQTQKQQSRISGRHGHQAAGALIPEGGLHVSNTKVCISSGNSRQPEATHYHMSEIKSSAQVSKGAMTPTYRDCKGQDRRHDGGTPVPSTNLHRAACGTKLTPGLPGNLQTASGCGQRGSPLANVGGTPSSSRVGPTGQYMTPRNLGQRREQVPGTALGTRQVPPMQQRQAPTQNRHTPGQGRAVLTPRVAQLCRSSNQGKGTGTVHGGTRKFPGPAGLLPKLCPGQKVKEAVVTVPAETVESNAKKEDASEEEVAVGDFEHGAWFRMKTELGIRDSDPNSILQQNNIALVIRKASLKQLTKNKVTHLCVMLKTISINSNDASVTLCDPSGQMQGTIHRRLVEDHQTELKPGSVLVLRQVGVLSPSQRNHYLNITPSNLVQVFPIEGLSKTRRPEKLQRDQ